MMLSMMTPAIIGASILLAACRESSSWVLLPIYSQLPKTRNYRSTADAVVYSSRPGIIFEDESDCPDEDECEIDWGAMPGFEDDEESDGENSKEKEQAAIIDEQQTNVVPGIFFEDESDCPDEDECEIDWGAMPGFEDDDESDKENSKEKEQATAIIEEQQTTDNRPGIFFEDESDCPDEDECEIDWGAMPGFEDDEENDGESDGENSKEKEQAAIIIEEEQTTDKLDKLEPQETYVRQVERSVEKSRIILEMNWQIEDCIVASL